MQIMNVKVVTVALVSVMACAGNSPTSVTTSEAPDGGYWADGGWMMDGGHH